MTTTLLTRQLDEEDHSCIGAFSKSGISRARGSGARVKFSLHFVDVRLLSPARVRVFRAAAVGLFAVTVTAAVLSSRSADWRPLWLFFVLAVMGIVGDRIHARTGRMRLSAGLTIVALAMALLGPAPAVAICFASRIIDAVRADGLRLRGRRLALIWNLGMYVDVLLGALVIRAAADGGISRGSATFALVVVAAVSAANFLNFCLAATWIRVWSGVPIIQQLRRDYVPALPWISAPNFVAGALVVLYAHAGPTSLVLWLALLGAFYVLLAELLRSQQRRDELEERTLQLASLQVGVLVTMVRTLSLRDQFTARHTAAVARYAHAIAQAAGCSEEELRTVHTAGLLHDIGKFAFPDRILLADGGLTEADYEIVRQHPAQGAELVRRVEGMEEIAAVILAHHERIDGAGYPRGLHGEEISRLARMISVGDVYDVMTARDTYRTPVPREQAIAEIRRVAGTQLDAEYVELFVDILEREDIAFTHTEDADFEAELAAEERIRELAQPRAPVSA
jgi:putative nucleotidyltransferase with HDIG domain